MMKKRVKMSRRGARRMARKGLMTENRNIVPPPQRGGYRM